MEVNRKATLMNKIRTQQASFIGHVVRKHSMEHLITTAKIEWKRARGRQRETEGENFRRYCSMDWIVKNNWYHNAHGRQRGVAAHDL